MLNFMDEDGRIYPFQYIEHCANKVMISLRSGCFCNPGIDEINHKISVQDLENFFATRTHGDYDDMINHLGKWRGAVRISLGYPTTKADIEKFFSFAAQFLDKKISPEVFKQ